MGQSVQWGPGGSTVRVAEATASRVAVAWRAALSGGQCIATLCDMETITHRELRNDSAEVLRRVARGETLQVTNNGRPAAVVGPVGGSILDELIARGQARPAQSPASAWSRIRSRLADRAAPTRPTAEMLTDARGRW